MLTRADEGYVWVEKPYTLEGYKPYRMNVVLAQWLRENNKIVTVEDFFLDLNRNPDAAGWIVHRNKKRHQKLALFKVANFPAHGVLDVSSTLDTVLHSYLSHANNVDFNEAKNTLCQELIIPIADLSRTHYRLLVIKPHENIAVFYDSKSKWVGLASEVIASGTVAIKKALATQEMDFFENYSYIERTCKKYFYDMEVQNQFLEHQEITDNTNCGPYTLEYVKTELRGMIPSKSLKIDIPDSRAEHEKLFKRYFAKPPTIDEDSFLRLRIYSGNEAPAVTPKLHPKKAKIKPKTHESKSMFFKSKTISILPEKISEDDNDLYEYEKIDFFS